MLKTKLLVLAIWIAGAACNCAFAQQQSDLSPNKEKALTHEMLVSKYNFPVKKHTGNSEKDQRVYAAEKKKWVAAHPDLYRRYNEQGVKSSHEQRRKAQPVLSPSK